MSIDLKAVEIMKPGKWNGIPFTSKDLNQIAVNYRQFADVHRVPLKLGHNAEQPLTDGQPAMGWVENVRMEGDALVADFLNVPKVIKKLIKRKQFRAVSVELLMNAKHMGKKIAHLLDAVAILGADAPAVNTLGDLDQFLAARSDAIQGGQSMVFSTVQTDPELLELRREAAAAKAELEAERKADFQRRLKAHDDEIDEILNEAVGEALLMPFQRDIWKEIFFGEMTDKQRLAFSADKIRQLKPQPELIARLLGHSAHAPKGGHLPTDPQLAVDQLTREVMAADPKLDYHAAMGIAARANPDTFAAYVDR